MLINIVLMLTALALGGLGAQDYAQACRETTQSMMDDGADAGIIKQPHAHGYVAEEGNPAGLQSTSRLLTTQQVRVLLHDSCKRLRRDIDTATTPLHHTLPHTCAGSIAAALLQWQSPFRPTHYHVVGLRHIIC